MIVGSATETIVDESMAVNRAASRPVIASRIWRWVMGAASAARRGTTVADTEHLLRLLQWVVTRSLIACFVQL